MKILRTETSVLPSHARRSRLRAHRPLPERLESRELLTTVDLGRLEFQSSNFTNSGTAYSIGTGGSALVGLVPASGKAFTPLAQIALDSSPAANLTFDTVASTPAFSLTHGEIDSVIQGGPVVPIYKIAGLFSQAFDVSQLLSANGFNVGQDNTVTPVTVARLAFTPAAIVFADGPGGDTTHSEIQLQGTLTPPAFNNFNWGGLALNVTGGNYVHLNPSGISLDGASLSTSSYTFSAFGITAAVMPTVAYSHVNGDSFTFGGSATLTSAPQPFTNKSAFDKVGAGLALKIQDGGIVALAFNITGAVTILDLQFATDDGNSPGFSYDFAQDRYEIKGGLTTTFNDGNSSVDLNLGYANNPSDPGIVIQGGTLQQFNATINTNLSIAGASLTTNNNGLTFSYDAAMDRFELYGGSANAALTLNLANSRSISVFLGDATTPGLVVKDGTLQSVNLGVSGQFSLAGMTVRAQAAALQYSKNGNGNDQYMLSGTLSVTGIFNASLSLGTQAQPGIVIRDGDFQLDNIKIELGKANLGAFTIKDLEVAYMKSGGDYTVSGGATLIFPAGWSVGGTFSVLDGKIDELGLSYAAAGIGEGIPIGSTGLNLVAMSGMVSNLDSPANLIVTASVGVVYGEQITILGKSVAIFAATGTVTVDKDEFKLTADAYFGAFGTATAFQGILGQGSATVDLDWGDQDYSADLSLTLFDGAFQFDASFQLDTTANIVISAKAIVAMPKDIPFIGGKTLASLDFLMEYHAHGGANGGPEGFAAGWAEVDVFGKHDVGVKYDMITKDFTVIGTSGVKYLTSPPTPAPGIFYYDYTITVPTDANNQIDATTATLGVQFTPEGGTQTISISTNGSNYIDQSAFSAANGLTFLPTLNTSGQITVDVVGSSTDPTVALPSDTYYLRLASTVQFSTADAPVFTASFSYPKPTVALTVPVSGPSGGSEVVIVTFATTVAAAFQPDTTVSLYYDGDNSGYDGALVMGGLPLSILASGVPFDMSQLLPGTYYLYASINDGTNAPTLSAYSIGVVPPPPLVSGTASDKLTGVSLSGFTVYVDANNDGQYDPGTDPGTTTGTSGYYQFTADELSGLTTNTTYHVAIVIPQGYQVDEDSQASNPYLYLADDAGHYNFDYALDALASIGGMVYDDVNQDGKHDACDPLRPNVTAYIDANGNGQLDPGETTATTDNSGSYIFNGVAEGATYAIRMVVPVGSFQTGPTSGFYSVNTNNISPTEQLLGNDFGLIRYSTISGTVKGYPLVDNRLAPTTQPLAGWTVNLLSGATIVQTTTSLADGTYSFLARPGSYAIAEVPPVGWTQTAPVSTLLQFTPTFIPTSIDPNTLAAADFDGDGKLDFATTNMNVVAQPAIYYGNGDGTFSNTESPTNLVIPGLASDQRAIALVTLNSNFDGKNLPDLAVMVRGDNGSDLVYIFKNNGGRGAGQFTLMPGPTFTTPPDSSGLQMIAGDFSGNGDEDLAISYNLDTGNASSVGVMIWLASTGKTYAQPLAVVRNGAIATADINGDGYQDIVVGGGTTLLDLSVIYGDGTGGANGPLILQSITLKNVFTSAIALGDVNGDGKPDVLLAGGNPANGATASEYILNSGGRFAEDSTSSAMLGGVGQLTQALLADVNGDGLLDVILAASGLNDPLVILTNSGQNTLGSQFINQPQVPRNGSSVIQKLISADLNGDGFGDLLIADSGNDGVYVLNNRTVVTPESIAVQVSPDVDAIGNTFTNAQIGQVSGAIYRDANRTGTREPSEAGMAGVILYVDLNGNGVYDPTDPIATTNADGLYAFDGLPAGQSRLRLLSAPGNIIITPGLGSHAVVIGSGRSSPSRDFGIDASLVALPVEQPPATPVGGAIRFQATPSIAAAGRLLRFVLESGAPAGMTIDARTGAVAWTANVAPGSYPIGIRVYDVKTPRVSETTAYSVTVSPSFAAPFVPAIPDATIDEFGTLTWVVAATDPSMPAGALNFALDSSSPAGATINPATGALSWVASVAPGTYTFTVLVTNAAKPDLITSQIFHAIVRDVAPSVAPIGPTTLPVGAILNSSGSFADPGLGGWTATVDYGDGSGALPLALGTDKTFRLSHQYANVGDFVATIAVRDTFGGVGTSRVIVDVTGPPAVAQVIVGDGSPQRSVIKTLAVVFVGPVSISPGAFELRGPGNRRIGLTTTVSTSSDGSTIATIGFAGPGTRNGTLVNGRYRLIIHAGRIVDAYGRALDGKPGSDRVVKFRRLLGDLNGDGRVNRADKALAHQKPAIHARKVVAPKGPMAHTLTRSSFAGRTAK